MDIPVYIPHKFHYPFDHLGNHCMFEYQYNTFFHDMHLYYYSNIIHKSKNVDIVNTVEILIVQMLFKENDVSSQVFRFETNIIFVFHFFHHVVFRFSNKRCIHFKNIYWHRWVKSC